MNTLVTQRHVRIQNTTDAVVQLDQRTGIAIANNDGTNRDLTAIKDLIPILQAHADKLSVARYPQEINAIKAQCHQLVQLLSTRIVPLLEQLVILSLILAMIIICVAFAMVLTNDTQHNLKRVIEHARLIANGDLRSSIKTHREDEFGEAFNVLEGMREALHAKMSTILAHTDHAVAITPPVLSNSQIILDLIKNTEDAAVAVAAATNEMVASTHEIAGDCEKASTAAQFTNDIATKSMTTVQGSISGIHQQAQQTKLDSDQIVNLVEHSQNINSIVETIDEIAAQTNLLALNAAIEAARAGEAGRGFAVVADEVRALASRTSSSTKEISNMVTRIQKDANDATKAMSNSVTSMDGIAQSAQDVDSQLQEVLNHMGAVSDQVTHIAAATEQQSATTTDISNNMHNITRATTEISTETSNTVDSIHESVDVIKQLKNEVSTFQL